VPSDVEITALQRGAGSRCECDRHDAKRARWLRILRAGKSDGAKLCAMLTKATSVILICLAFSCADAAATTPSGYREATRRWIVARYTEQRAKAKVLPVGAAAAERVVDGMEATCPQALRGAPLTSQKDKLAAEAVEDVALVGEAPARHAVEQYVNTVRPLRWSNRGLDHIASLSAEAQLRRFAVTPTDFCGDVAYWKAHGYQLAPATVEFRQALENANRKVSEPGWVERIEMQLRLLGNRTENRLLRRIRAAEPPNNHASPAGHAISRLTVVGVEFATPL
jgi:hypothetical protein